MRLFSKFMKGVESRITYSACVEMMQQAGGDQASSEGSADANKDDVVDAEFEEVKDEEKKD